MASIVLAYALFEKSNAKKTTDKIIPKTSMNLTNHPIK
jgi:hypothetical protein